MSERMAMIQRDALDALARLTSEHHAVKISRVGQHYAVTIGTRWYDGGTIEEAVNAAATAELAARRD